MKTPMRIRCNCCGRIIPSGKGHSRRVYFPRAGHSVRGFICDLCNDNAPVVCDAKKPRKVNQDEKREVTRTEAANN